MSKRSLYVVLVSLAAMLASLFVPANADANGDTSSSSSGSSSSSDCSGYTTVSTGSSSSSSSSSSSDSDDCCPDGSGSSSSSSSSSSTGSSGCTTTEVFDADKTVTYVCPAGYDGPDANNQCSKTERETFPATPVYAYFCKDGYQGPDVNNKCVKEVTTTETVHVDTSTEFVCLDGFTLVDAGAAALCERDIIEVNNVPVESETVLNCPVDYLGPDANGQCTRVSQESTPATTQVDTRCLDGFTEVVVRPTPICEREIIELVEVPVAIADRVECPVGYSGPDANFECSQLVLETKPAVLQTDLVCPPGFSGPDLFGTCSRDVEQTEYKGVIVELVSTCPTSFVLDGDLCLRDTIPPTRYFCSQPFLTLDETVTPPVCRGTFEEIALSELFCEDPLEGPLTGPNGDLVCRESIDAGTDVTVRCPDGYVGPDSMNLCERTVSFVEQLPAEPVDSLVCEFGYLGPNGAGDCVKIVEDIVDAIFTSETLCPDSAIGPEPDGKCFEVVTVIEQIPAIVIETLVCDAGYLGPDENGDCFRMTDEVIDADETIRLLCPPNAIGPQPNGQCFELRTVVISLPAIERPVFTCPAGYDGPDAAWNCSKEVTETLMTEAKRRLVGYECPTDASGPTAQGECYREVTKTVEADKRVVWTCPADSIGPDNNNQCTRTVVVEPVCVITFYDYNNGHKKLFSESRPGSYNLTGSLEQYRNDASSVHVPHGCSVSAADHNNGHGWCYSYGPGLHNLPHNDMSWFSIPATGCDTHG